MPGESAGHAVTAEGLRSQAGRVPDFFIAGHQKCGTTALYEMLRRHPQIFMSAVKEPRYFCTDLYSRFPPRSAEAKRLRTLEGYLSLFAAAEPGQLAGEASPQYLRSRAAPAEIAAVQPNAKIIAILREPAAFLRSLHMQMVSSNQETEKDFRRAVELEPARREGREIPARCQHPDVLLYTDHVRYVEQLHRFREMFGTENVLVIIYDDFRRDNESTVRDVLRFLGVDDTLPVQTIDTKPLKAVRSLPLHRLANAARTARHNPAAAGPVGRAVNALTPGALRSELARGLWRRMVYQPPAAPDEAFMRELRGRLKPEVEAVSEYLGRDLVSEWGYDRLG
ncbi:MAG TPA: sulfotransferase [Solirubrobacteraceae bacterium]